MDQERIGNFIAEKRKEKKLTQEELANKLNVSNKTISRWETGKNLPDLSLFPELSTILGISVNDLMSGYTVDKKEYQEKFEQNMVETIDKVDKKKDHWNLAANFLIFFFSIALLIVITNILLNTISFPIKVKETNFKIKQVNNAIDIEYENIYNGIYDYVITEDEKENIIVFLSIKQTLKGKIETRFQENKKHNLIEEKHVDNIRIVSDLFKIKNFQIYYVEGNLKEVRKTPKEKVKLLKEKATLIYEKK